MFHVFDTTDATAGMRPFDRRKPWFGGGHKARLARFADHGKSKEAPFYHDIRGSCQTHGRKISTDKLPFKEKNHLRRTGVLKIKSSPAVHSQHHDHPSTALLAAYS